MTYAARGRSVAKLLGAVLLLACGAKTELPLSDCATDEAMCVPGAGSGGSEASGDTHDDPVPPGVKQTDKVDLLFVVDNSISMADKQVLLASAVPGLLARLINPLCVSPSDPSDTVSAPASYACPPGYEKEFVPVADIHIGVITSSLGGHGGNSCSPGGPGFDVTQDDRARLLGTVRTGIPTYQNLGFLAWDPMGAKNPPGETNEQALLLNFQNMIDSVGEIGCGFEAPLEAWYRFLFDPTPPLNVMVQDESAVLEGVDEIVLQQRAAFLRPDSLLAIIMLSDENDCSVVDGGLGWVVTLSSVSSGNRFTMPRSTSACALDPNDACCRPCAENEAQPPAGCSALSDDLECKKGAFLTSAEDEMNLRCYAQKRRFGIDLLYPVSRYVEALTRATVETRDGSRVPNPVYSDLTLTGSRVRDQSLVFLAGIVGVPWQDIATPESLSGRNLEYLSAAELSAENRWNVILGDPDNHVPASDPLMVESQEPRAGTNPIIGAAIAPPTSLDPQENPINGHEYYTSTSSGTIELQYACIFPLLEGSRDCSVLPYPAGCDCTEADLWKNKPLCNPPGGGPAGTVQYFAKAHPGLRHLAVLRGYGKNAIVASICPKNATGTLADPAFGYNPAMNVLIERFRAGLY